jgi:hypothetical protein
MPAGWSLVGVKHCALVMESTGAVVTVTGDSVEVDHGGLAPASTQTPTEHLRWIAKCSAMVGAHGAEAVRDALAGAK